jgi:hypothetical protein
MYRRFHNGIGCTNAGGEVGDEESSRAAVQGKEGFLLRSMLCPDASANQL